MDTQGKAGDVHPSSFMAATALLRPSRPATRNPQPSWPRRRLKASPCAWHVSGAPAVWPACVCNTGLLVTCMCEGALPNLLQRSQQAAAALVASQVGRHTPPHDSGMRPMTWGSIRAWQHSLPLHLELYMSRQDQGAPELLHGSKQAAAALVADDMQASAFVALLPSDLEIPVHVMVLTPQLPDQHASVTSRMEKAHPSSFRAASRLPLPSWPTRWDT